MNHEIFISYSSKQKSVADGVCHYLEENGYKCWMAPRDIPAGSTYADLIDKAIVGSQIVVLVFSESASFSKWVKAEINVAFDEDKLILPFRIDETKITGSFRLMLNQMHWVEAFPHYADKLPILLESIGNLIGKRDRPQTSITVTEPIATIDVKPSDSPHDLKLYSDLECYFFLDGEAKGRLRAGSVKKIPLKQGEYHFLFVGADNENDLIEMDYSMPATDKLLRIALEPVRTERLRIEELRASEQRYLEQNEKIKRIEFATKGEFTVNGVAFKMIFVEGGRFLMGAPDDDKDASFNERPRHGVTLSDFYVGETLVTQELWLAVMDKNPSMYVGPTNPVENISWKSITQPGGFLEKLNAALSDQLPSSWFFRAPTEAEWEYAARGGLKSKGYRFSGSDDIDKVAWHKKNSGGHPHPVKQKEPNELGLYDMSGNVFEPCMDRQEIYHDVELTNPVGRTKCWDRASRGGSYYHRAQECRITNRSIFTSGFSGFRLVLQIGEKA